MIKVENLTKKFGRTTAVDNLSFKVGRGEIVGFLGPNGAGKTTTMRMLAGYLTPTGGRAFINDMDIKKYSLECRRHIGYMPENVPLYTDMRVVEFLAFRGRLKGMRGRFLRSRIDEVLISCGLTGVRKKIIGHLSKGYRQRVGLADALLAEPEILILDEPTIGLDPNQIRLIRNLIKGLANKHTVLLSSHILHEIEMICERVLIINKGSVIASDTPQKLVGLMKGNAHVVAEIKGDKHLVMDELRGLSGIEGVEWEDADGWGKYTCECSGTDDVREKVFKKVADCGWVMREITLEKRNLEDVFISMTGDGGAEK